MMIASSGYGYYSVGSSSYYDFYAYLYGYFPYVQAAGDSVAESHCCTIPHPTPALCLLLRAVRAPPRGGCSLVCVALLLLLLLLLLLRVCMYSARPGIHVSSHYYYRYACMPLGGVLLFCWYLLRVRAGLVAAVVAAAAWGVGGGWLAGARGRTARTTATTTGTEEARRRSSSPAAITAVARPASSSRGTRGTTTTTGPSVRTVRAVP